MAILRGCYHQILRPRRHFAKFTDSFCRHANVPVDLNLHAGRQATKSNLERGNASGFISHVGSLLSVGYPAVLQPHQRWSTTAGFSSFANTRASRHRVSLRM
jgi:hypothetical protein